MPECDIIVVGGSAGSVEAMMELVRPLPASLAATIFVTLHVSPDFPSLLPEILQRSGALPARHPKDGDRFKRGEILVAPPDRHLELQDGTVRVTRGPRENRHRPAIDPLFRSAARDHDSRVIGVVLSGYFDDGAAGLGAIRARGGLGIVQDPAEALAGQMPESALAYGGADYILPSKEIGFRIMELVNHKNCGKGRMKKKRRKSLPAKAGRKKSEHGGEANLFVATPHGGEGHPSAFSCPDCGGVLWELRNGKLARFRCRVGHAYTMTSLAEEQVHDVENALWAAMRGLEEKAALATRVAESMSDARMRKRFLEQAIADRNYAQTLRKMLFADDKEAVVSSQ